MANSIQKIHKTLTQMQKNLECSICLELLQDPVLTKCEHHFCNFCVLALLQSKRRSSAPCPLCKEPITKRGLTTHSTLKGIVTAFQNVVAAVEDDTGQKCTPPRGPLPFSQPEPPSQRPKRQEKKIEKKSNVRRGKAKNIPIIPIYLDDEEEDALGQSTEQCPPLKNNINVMSSLPSPRKTKKIDKKSNFRKGKENTQQSETEDDQEINGQTDILEVIANESLGQNGRAERTKQSQRRYGGGLESQPAEGGVLLSTVNKEKNVGRDPYEFIASQRTPRKLKKRRVKEKKKKPWEYSYRKISRKKKDSEGFDSERWAESQSDDDYEDSTYVHREDIENKDEREEDEKGTDDGKETGESCRKEENKDGNQEGQKINEKQIERIDSNDEEGVEEERGRENGEEREVSVTEDGDRVSDHRAMESRGRKRLRNAASKAMDAIKGQVISQSSGEGSIPAGGGCCHGDQDANRIAVTEDSYGRSLIDFGTVHNDKDKFPVVERTEECRSPLTTNRAENLSSASHLVNGHTSQEFPLSQPPTLNRNHGDKLFAKAYGRGKTRSPGERVVAQQRKLEDDDLPDVMNIDIESDDEGKGNSQELFVGDVLDPTPPGDAGKTVGGNSAADGDFNLEEVREYDKEICLEEAGKNEENMAKDVTNCMLEEGQFDDLEVDVEASDQTTHQGRGNGSGVEIFADSACPQLLKNGASSFTEQTNELEKKEILEENISECEKKHKQSEEQFIENGDLGDIKENATASDEEEIVVRREKKRETLKDKMRNKVGLTTGEVANIALNDPEEHLQSDWELALKLAQEFGSVPQNLEVRHSKRVNSKNDVNSCGKRGRKMRQLQIQNVPDTSDRGQHSRRARSKRNLRSKVAEESDDVDINSFQDDFKGCGKYGESQGEMRQARNETKVKKDNIKSAKLNDEKESSVQCVPETPHVLVKIARGSLSSVKKKTKNKRKEVYVEVESGHVLVIGDGEIKTAEPSRALESKEKMSEVPKTQQQAKGRSKEKGSDELSNIPTDDEETVHDGSTNKRGRRKSSRLSKSQDEKMRSDKYRGFESKRKVDSNAGMEDEGEKEIGRTGASGEERQGRRKSAGLSKSQEETTLDERKERRKSNSESDVKEGEEAEEIVIVVNDGSDEEINGDHVQVKRTSARLLTKSQEKKMEKSILVGDTADKGKERGMFQGRTGKSQAASVSEEERQDMRGGNGQKRRSLRKKKEDCTQGDGKGGKTMSSQLFDKGHQKLDGDHISKESCLGRENSDTVPSLRKGRKGNSPTDETPQMDATMKAGAESSCKLSIVERKTQGLSGSTTESIELDTNPTFAQPDGDFNLEKSLQNKNFERKKAQRGRESTSQENLSLTGFEKVDDVAKEEKTQDRESCSLRERRRSTRNSRDVKERDRNKKDSFDGTEKRFSESEEKKKLKRGEKNGDDEKSGSLHLLNVEDESDADVREDDTKHSVGLGKSKLRSRSSGRKGKETPEKKNLKDGSSGVHDDKEEESIRRSSRRQKKDVSVKGQAEDGANISTIKNNEEKVSESERIDQNKEEEKIEALEQEEEEGNDETRTANDRDVGRTGETDEGSVVVAKKDPTSPDIFTMHLEASEQEAGDSIGRSNCEDEPTKGETEAWGEADGGETPKTSKRKKKKRKSFSFGNEANLVKGSLTDDYPVGNVREDSKEKLRDVPKSGSTTNAGLELTEDEPQSKGDNSSHCQFVPATEGASESHGNFSDQIPIPRSLLRRRKEKSQESSESWRELQREKSEKGELFSEEVMSIKRISSLKSRGKRQVEKRKDDSEMSSKRFCSDSQYSLNSGEEESMVPPTPPVTASFCQTDAVDGSGNSSKCNSHDKEITDRVATTKKSDSLVQAFEKVKRYEEKGSGSNQEDKVTSSLSSPSISLFQDVEITGEQGTEKRTEEVAEPMSGGESLGAIDQSETCKGVPGKEVEGNKTSRQDNDSHGSSPEDLPNVLGDGAVSCGDIQENVVPEMSKNNVADLERDVGVENGEKDKFVQPKSKHFDEEEPLFDDDYPVSPASSIGRHNLTSASSVLSSQSEVMTSQQQDNAKKVLENMEKEIAEMERALAEEEEVIEQVSEEDEVSDEEETDENERGKITKGKPERRNDVIITSQEAKDCEDGLEGVESIDLSSDEDETDVSKKQQEEDRDRRRKTPDRHTSGCGGKVLKKYSKYENLDDIDDDDIAQNVKQNLTEMAEAEKSLDSLLKAHAARRREEKEEEEEEASGSEDEEEVHVGRPSTPPLPSPSSSPPRSPSPAPLLSQKTLARRLSPLQRNIQKAEEIVKSYSEERPVTSQKRRRVVIEESDSESEDEVQYRNKRKKSLKLDSLESCDADEKVKGQRNGKKVESTHKVKSPPQKIRKEAPPKIISESRDMNVVENHSKISPRGGGMQHDSPDRKKVTTPQTSNSGSGGSNNKKKPRKGEMMSLVATGLNKQKLKMVDQLCKKAGCKFSSVFIPSTTHVIVNAGDNLTCERTLKYFQGIAARRWVISFQWVQDSLSASRLLPLEKYEIRGDSVNGQNHCGPRRARLWKGPPLLGDYNLFCLEPYTGLNKDQLEGLLKACGGSVYQQPSEMPQEDGKENFIVAQHDVQEEENTDYQAMYEKFQAKVISREWVLDSIAVYTTQPITDYLLCDVTECDDIEDLMSDDEF